MNRDILAKGIEIIGVLFAAFGGFLAGIAPPGEADARFAVGLASFLALIILFLVAATAKRLTKRTWITIAIVSFVMILAAAYWYKSDWEAYTFEYPPLSGPRDQIAGTELTEKAKEYLQLHPGLSNSSLLFDYGPANKDLVWPPKSVRDAKIRLIGSYVLLVLSIATAIFALVEGVLGNTPKRSSPRPTPADAENPPAQAATTRRKE